MDIITSVIRRAFFRQWGAAYGWSIKVRVLRIATVFILRGLFRVAVGLSLLLCALTVSLWISRYWCGGKERWSGRGTKIHTHLVVRTDGIGVTYRAPGWWRMDIDLPGSPWTTLADIAQYDQMLSKWASQHPVQYALGVAINPAMRIVTPTYVSFAGFDFYVSEIS